MRLLIITQVVDSDHPILGFFHRWIAQFAQECESVLVICLQEGTHALPDNVRVLSLGKQAGQRVSLVDRTRFAARFLMLIWKHRHEYDAVFVHMNQIYVILGGLVWRMLGKQIGLWYAHGTVTRSLRIATKLAHMLFTASPESFRIDSPKVRVMGHGIDTELFKPTRVPKDLDLITIGRIAPSKRLEVLVSILTRVREQYPGTLTIIGAPLNNDDLAYERTLRADIEARGLSDAVQFIGPVPQRELPGYLNRARVFVHAATTGSLDKALLEPMACGIPVITNAAGAATLPLGEWLVGSEEEFAQRVGEVLVTDVHDHVANYHSYIAQNHSILTLISRICKAYE